MGVKNKKYVYKGEFTNKQKNTVKKRSLNK